MATKTLNVHNATITTATVEIKALSISGKQVTLAVFRQLREEPLIGDEGTLNGVPWGIVNYHPDKCAYDKKSHWHVVWQRGTELLRSSVDENPFDVWSSPTANAFYKLCVWECDNGSTEYFDGKPPSRFSSLGEGWRPRYTFFNVGDFRIRVEVDEGVQGIVHRISDKRCLSYERSVLEEYCNEVGMTASELHEKLCEEVRDEKARRTRHNQVRAAIAELPQLFIAV